MLSFYRRRARLVRILFGAFMVLVSLSMLTYLIPSYGTDAPANGTVVAEVGKADITPSDI